LSALIFHFRPFFLFFFILFILHEGDRNADYRLNHLHAAVLKPGDVVEVEVEGAEILRNPIAPTR